MSTEYKGIDYSLGQSNVDKKTGIHYGVISQHRVGTFWYEGSEAYYGYSETATCPDCGNEQSAGSGFEWGDTITCDNEECGHEFEIELPDCADPISHFIDNEEYAAECGESGDIFITRSPYYTYAQFCSPCAPGAGYLMNECPTGAKTYCFDHDCFEDGKAPYTVFRVSDDSIVNPTV